MANKIAHHTDDELAGIALTSLSHIFEMPIDGLKTHIARLHVFNWKTGAYSYPTTRSKLAEALS